MGKITIDPIYLEILIGINWVHTTNEQYIKYLKEYYDVDAQKIVEVIADSDTLTILYEKSIG